ncbi:MAG: rod shape-determining protein MreD [Chloroflexota bacterium]|nr:MAG: rod shape-determining protein MreD [Chloroflexota bacterium]
MRKYGFIPLLLLTAILQTTLLSRMTINDVKPDLMLMLVVAQTVFGGAVAGMVWGLVGGLFLDLLSRGSFDALVLVLPFVAFVAGTMTGESLRHRFVLPLILAFLGSLLQGGLIILALQLANLPVFWTVSLISTVVQGATINTALMPLVYLAFNRWGPRKHGLHASHWNWKGS